MKVVSVCILTVLISVVENTAMKCNEFKELCDLDITQVTLAGSHNSGAGFDGHLNYHTFMGRVKALSCFYRNQIKDFYDQLQLGVRYFDIDACGQDTYEPKGAWICHQNAYGGSIKKMFEQIDRWMNEAANRNEVVVIHFNRDYDYDSRVAAGADIIKQVNSKWYSQVNSNKLSVQSSIYVKLREAIRSNNRIYVIMHQKLTDNQANAPWVIPYWRVGYTWTDMAYINSNGCYGLMEAMGEKRCLREAWHDFVRYDMYLSVGLCVHDLASKCRRYLKEGVNQCFKGTVTMQRTVNFLVVDYVNDVVVTTARNHNIRNIKMYLGKDV